MKAQTRNWKDLGEVRLNDDGSVDEVVLEPISVHLEQLDNGVWWLGLGHGETMMRIYLFTKRNAKIFCNVETDDGLISEGSFK